MPVIFVPIGKTEVGYHSVQLYILNSFSFFFSHVRQIGSVLINLYRYDHMIL